MSCQKACCALLRYRLKLSLILSQYMWYYNMQNLIWGGKAKKTFTKLLICRQKNGEAIMKKSIIATLLLILLIPISTIGGEMKNLKVGDIVSFGTFEQDNDLDNGQEPIEWEVMEIEDGKAFLLSCYALDYLPFNIEDEDVTWENCTLRTWLNQDFFSSAFSDSEKAMIANTVIVNEDKYKDENNIWTDTKDNVFLLSLTEIEKYYGIGPNEWRQENDNLVCYVTEYGRARYIPAAAEHDGITIEEAEEMLQNEEKTFGHGMCNWWLRTKDDYYFISGIRYDGWVKGANVAEQFFAVRPALWINLE